MILSNDVHSRYARDVFVAACRPLGGGDAPWWAQWAAAHPGTGPGEWVEHIAPGPAGVLAVGPMEDDDRIWCVLPPGVAPGDVVAIYRSSGGASIVWSRRDGRDQVAIGREPVGYGPLRWGEEGFREASVRDFLSTGRHWPLDVEAT